MAADVLSMAGHSVSLFEKRKGPGRKLLVAGSSGLNISNAIGPKEFVRQYRGGTEEFWAQLFKIFSVRDWLSFIEKELHQKTFLGSSGHYFVEGMRASRLLRAWIHRLANQGVNFFYHHELIDFEVTSQGVRLDFKAKVIEYDAVGLALGGGSWEASLPEWPQMFLGKGIGFESWRPSNVGYQVAWPKGVLQEAEGLPLKNVVLSVGSQKKQGDLVITRYGIEGAPIYHLGKTGTALIDLEPNLTEAQILKKCDAVKENHSAIRRVFKKLSLCPATKAVLFHGVPPEKKQNLQELVKWIKAFPVELLGPQPLSEAISSAGGITFESFGSDLMLKKYPGVFVAGEMLAWDVPTGGFLIQGSASQGFLMGKSIEQFLLKKKCSH